MTGLRFVEAVRYSIPGGLFLLMAAWSYPPIAQLVGRGGAFEAAFFAAASSLLIGTVLQLVHRAVIYPVIYRALLVRVVEQRRVSAKDVWSSYTPSDHELRVTVARWRFTPQPENAGAASRLEEWGAQVHFLYAACWAVALALVMPAVAGLNPDYRRGLIAGVVCLVLLGAALVHDRRMMLHERRVVDV